MGRHGKAKRRQVITRREASFQIPPGYEER